MGEEVERKLSLLLLPAQWIAELQEWALVLEWKLSLLMLAAQ